MDQVKFNGKDFKAQRSHSHGIRYVIINFTLLFFLNQEWTLRRVRLNMLKGFCAGFCHYPYLRNENCFPFASQLLIIYLQYCFNSLPIFYFHDYWQTTFDAPEGNDPIVLNLDSMGKGYTWINGQGIGRYWVSFQTPRGTPSQKWYNPIHNNFKNSYFPK